MGLLRTSVRESYVCNWSRMWRISCISLCKKTFNNKHFHHLDSEKCNCRQKVVWRVWKINFFHNKTLYCNCAIFSTRGILFFSIKRPRSETKWFCQFRNTAYFTNVKKFANFASKTFLTKAFLTPLLLGYIPTFCSLIRKKIYILNMKLRIRAFGGCSIL